MSSLARQLQGIASLDASRLTSRTGAPSSKSYLFTPAEAAQQDLDAIYQIGLEGFAEIVELDPDMVEFEDELFSEAAKRTDRMMLNKEENRLLDVVLGRCLRRLGKWVGVMACGRCLEWLVRRFRVNEMNPETVLQVFLPYHDSPNFPRMLSILTIPTTSPYHAPFAPLVRSAQPLPRTYIATAISPAKEASLRLLRDVVGSVQLALKEGVVHRALLNFWSAVIVELLEKRNATEGVVKALVEAFVEIVSTPEAGQDINAAVYPPLVLLTRSIRLADGPFQAIVSALLTPATGANPAQRILTLLVLLEDRKVWTGGLGEHAPEWLAKVKLLGETLEAGMAKYGFEAALSVILPEMVKRPDNNARHFRVLIESPALAPSLVKIVAAGLLAFQANISSEQSARQIQSLLTSLRERHPTVVDQAIMSAGAQATVPQALRQNISNSEGFANVYAADVADRISGIQKMYILLESGDPANTASARQALRARLTDTELPVIEALYADPKAAVDALYEAYVDTVRSVFVDTSAPVKLVLLHLRFVTQHLLKVKPELSDRVFQRLIFSCLLSTQQRTVFGTTDWQSLVSSLGEESLLGQSRAVLELSPGEKANKTIIQMLSGSVSSSAKSKQWSEFLFSQVNSTVSTEAMLAQLVLAQIIHAASGERKVALAAAAFPHVLSAVQSLPVQRVQQAETPLADNLLQSVYQKQSEGQTGARVVLSVVAEISKVARPGGDMEWLNGHDSNAYQTLSRQLYTLANSGTLNSAFAAQILRNLLTQLAEDAPIVFASIWTDPTTPTSLRVAALRHVAAFVGAYTSQGQGVDLQMLVPALLVAVQDKDKEVRSATVAVLRAVAAAGKQEGGDVYAVNTFYGKQSGLVQLLKPAYLEKYLSLLLSNASDLILDPRRLSAVHASQLSNQPNHNKKDKGINRATIASLLSHLSAWRSVTPRLTILRSLAEVREHAVLKGAMPLLSPLLDDESEESAWLASLPVVERSTYLVALMANLDRQSAALLANPEGEVWTFIDALFSTSAGSVYAETLRGLVMQRMTDGVFAALPSSQKVAFVTLLIHSLPSLTSDERFVTRSALLKFVLIPSDITNALNEMASPLESTISKKRQRQDGETTEGDKVEMAIADLTVLLESRDWPALPGNAPLAAALMSVLSALLTKRQTVKEGVDYLEQELLGAILTIVEKIQDPAEVTKAHLGIEAIIKTIRSTSNPRTSQRALLVAAELARLIPDAVLHNVMPIFTFMGAADFQRDDAYSFGVVERTVKGIVPVLVKSLREAGATGLELWNASASFISIFTDMAGRLPKHRTLPFFTHLVDALGRSDYLAPVSMLLIDRTTGRPGKSGSSIAGAVELAVGVAASAGVDIKLSVILDTVKEVGRLLADLPSPDKTAFLSQFSAENGDADRTIRRLSALLAFATSLTSQLVGKPVDQDLAQAIVLELVKLSASSKSALVEHSDVPHALQKCLMASMKLLSAEKFLDIVRQLAETEGQEDIVRSLDIFAERLPLIKKEVRAKSTAAIAGIIRRSADLLGSAAGTVRASLGAIRAVTLSALPAEDSALAAILPKLIGALSGQDAAILNEVLSLLEVSTRHLGPRVIPSIQSMLAAALALIARPAVSPSTAKAAFTVISSIIETVPTFIGAKQLGTILHAAMDSRDKHEESSSALIGTCAKKIPTKVLFPVVMELWKEVQRADESVLEGFFHLLRLTLRNADRAVLPGLIKTIFAFFLDVFDLRHKLQSKAIEPDVINRVEESAIGSFLELVTKLTEATFKPLFTRLYDWAVIDLSEGKAVNDLRLVERKTVLLHVMMGLLTKFRHLLSPYIGILLPHLEELLSAYSSGNITDPDLWTLLVRVLGKSFEVDDGAYWTEQLYMRLIPLLTAQIPVLADRTLLASSALSVSLAALAGSTTSEPILKALNTGICAHTRAEAVRVRMAALRCLDTVWEKQVEEMVGLVPETVSEYLAELIEDENKDVEAMARGVLGRIEKVTGSLKEYLE